MAAPLTSSQSSLASQLLQKSSIAIRPLLLWERACPRWRRRWFQARARWQASSYRKHRNLPPPPVGAGLPAMAALRASGRARWQASSYRKASQPAPPPVGAGLPAMAAPLVSSQSSLASQLLQKSTAISPLPLWERDCPRWQRCGLQAELAGKPAPTESIAICPLPLWERACPRWQRCCLQGRARWQASSYRKHRNLSPPPVGAGLPAMAAPLVSRQSSLASQLLQKGIVICPSPSGSGLARDGGAAGFKAELAGKPAPTERHRNLPPPPVGAGLPAMVAPRSSSQLLQISIDIYVLLFAALAPGPARLRGILGPPQRWVSIQNRFSFTYWRRILNAGRQLFKKSIKGRTSCKWSRRIASIQKKNSRKTL